MQVNILDNLDGMRKIDKSNMIDFCTNAAANFKASAQNAQKIKFTYPAPKNIILAGMGGSAIGGELLKDFTRNSAKVPLEVNREYSLPAYANKNSLGILASYSGDTEETLSSFLDAKRRGCMMFCISSGGALLRYAEKLGVPFLQVKSGMPPRGAMPHMFVPLIEIMDKLGMAPQNVWEDFAEATAVLEEVAKENLPTKNATENFTKTLASNLNGLIPAIYGFGYYRSVALRWKQQMNENSKNPAKWEYFSELNHNETMGWEGAKKLAKCYGVVLLREKNEPLEIRSRIEVTKSLMAPSISKIFEVWAQGKSELAKMLSTILVGDFTSVYLAMLRNVDPTPVKTVDAMKEQVEKNGVKKHILESLDELTRHA